MVKHSLASLAQEAGLERVGARPPLREYLKETWRRRDFAFTLARYRVEAQLGSNRLGLGWVVLRPILLAAMFGLVFGLIMPSTTRPSNFIPFLVTGVFIFEFFSTSLSQGARAITQNVGLVRTLSFPRILLPLATIAQRLIELVPMMVVLCLILIAFGEPITWWWLLTPVVLAVMTAFNLGIALIAARLTVHARDITQVIPILTRLIFYSSGIFYSLELVLADRPNLLRIAQLNPVHDYIALVRAQLVSGNAQSGVVWTIAVGAAVTALIAGVFFFWQAEERYGHE